jgi:hypothetical protein
MIDTTCTCQTGAGKVKKSRETEKNSVRGHAARKHLEKLGDLKSEPGLAEASILIADDRRGMRNFLVRRLEWTFSRVLACREFVTSAACPKRSRIGRITMLQGVGGTK